MATTVHIRVPASTANLGPGFDSFGLALALYHDLTVHAVGADASPVPAVALTLSGEGAKTLPTGEDSLVVRALRQALAADGYDGPDLDLHSVNAIPLARGLGSSAAAFLAGTAAGQMLTRGQLDEARLLASGTATEGHADNVAPCLYGGFTIVNRDAEGRVEWARFDVPEGLRAVVAVPDFELSTAASREVLPVSVTREVASSAVSHAGLVAAALVSGRPELLGRGMDDECLHEPYRAAFGTHTGCGGWVSATWRRSVTRVSGPRSCASPAAPART